MEGWSLIFTFVSGAIIGSFLNVCIYRIPKRRSLIFPNSFCPKCEAPIKWYDNIPIFSYLILKGKCRECKENISIRYLIVELITAILFVLLYKKFSISLVLLKNLILFSFLIIIAFIDLDFQLIFNRTTYPLVLIGLIFSVILPEGRILGSIVNSLLGLVLGAGILFLIAQLSIVIFKQEGMGGGDITLAAAIGTFLGSRDNIIMLILSVFIGAFVGLALILLKIKGRRDYIPFGPFIVLSTILVVFWKQEIINIVGQIFQLY